MILLQIEDGLLIIGLDMSDLEKLLTDESPMIPRVKSGLNREICLLKIEDREALMYALKEWVPKATIEVDSSFDLNDLQKTYALASNEAANEKEF